MARRWMAAGGLIVALALLGGLVDARASGDDIQDVVVLDNESVQVVLLTFPPGSVAEQHVNPEPELGIILEGELTLITPNGREVLKPGAVRWLPPRTPHESRNEGATPVRMWALLLKRCN
ncbi:MAG: cupin domain-containing protein [candidate division NC10 bacterium]|nr:cupin domain-containing protein [candidate division NC10 bacterium]MBI2117244.1 cupin domain-containing protein [candidate division NC10 bacterium]MBI2458496.1 cupin domain-containing protein [candidate division NC10 bacterium]MBI3085325.1 cupin domain-containing protein [candidate division NC10 bacterium]